MEIFLHGLTFNVYTPSKLLITFMTSNLYDWNDLTKIGVFLTATGVFFMTLGILFLLDSSLLTLGNILFVAGVVMVMGLERCKLFFFAQDRLRATACFAIGILMVMFGWCFIGLLVQGFGGLNLFGNFFPMIARMLEMTPIIGPVMRSPPVQKLLGMAGLAAPERNV